MYSESRPRPHPTTSARRPAPGGSSAPTRLALGRGTSHGTSARPSTASAYNCSNQPVGSPAAREAADSRFVSSSALIRAP